VFFDAEHFFDGYSDNAEYALRVVETAFTAGADRVILCDTNGGMLPDTIGLVVSAVIQHT
jgi:2-isopropylmalate synthase